MKRVWAGGVALFGGGALAALTTGLAVRSADGYPRTLYVLAVAAAVLAVICGAIWLLLRGEPTANGGGIQSGPHSRVQTARADGDSRAVAVGSVKGDFHYHEAGERPYEHVADEEIQASSSQIVAEFNELIEEGEELIQTVIRGRLPNRSIEELWRKRAESTIALHGNSSCLTDFKTAHHSQRPFKGVALVQEGWDRLRRLAAQVDVLRKCRDLIESSLPKSVPEKPSSGSPFIVVPPTRNESLSQVVSYPEMKPVYVARSRVWSDSVRLELSRVNQSPAELQIGGAFECFVTDPNGFQLQASFVTSGIGLVGTASYPSNFGDYAAFSTGTYEVLWTTSNPISIWSERLLAARSRFTILPTTK